MLHIFSRKGIFRTCISLACVCVLLLAVVLTVLGAETYETQKGITNVSGSRLNVRSGPDRTTQSLGMLNDETEVLIIGEEKNELEELWYKIEYKSETQDYGYVFSQYVTIIPKVDDSTSGEGGEGGYTPGDNVPQLPDMTDFEAYLDSQGFPESYRPYLRELHAIYPNWVFKAQKTGFDFDYAVSNELYQSLVWNGSISSWKSTANEDYNWDTNTWTGYDGANWVRASQGIIEHYMDPRNFLGINSVFQFLEQSFDENIQTVGGVKQIIAGTFMEKDVVDVDGTTLNYAEAIYNAGKEFGVNPYVLAAMIVQEQGTNGTSRIISGKVSGYENLFNYYNIGAWATPQFNNDAVLRGLWYASVGTSNLRPWNTRLKAIRGGASFYAANYTNSGQTTLYLKKFNVQGERPFTGQYMTNIQGAASEASEIAQGYSNEMRTFPLSFLIPVYENMHETPCPKPTKDGSPNMKLSLLSVTDYELTPGFERDITEYMIVVPENLSKITINAVALESSAKIGGIGEIEIPEKQNVLEVVVTAGNPRSSQEPVRMKEPIPE
ncbi:MAG: SH3 domain-containing protein [Clostridia bacterium]|nr:SH3 domain-containing protein [Clostridia bacterium]